ncbi:MAG: hypothetical protein NXI15_17505 [Gammaproteobacteria bacterium]|nr:hypothetical protein [Gammaproteobacteria bacterium]
MRGAVFTYHAQNCGGYDYASNDHIAFAADLHAVHEAGLPVVSLLDIALALATRTPQALPSHFVAFSCDDGTSLDWADYDHPQFGRQRAFANILRDHLARTSPGTFTDSTLTDSTQNLLTAFVIACPVARAAIDHGCYGGLPLSDDNWWAEAAAEGLVAIENHSWDHVHATLPASLQRYGAGGDFSSVDNYARADRQVRCAAQCIDERLRPVGKRTQLFAYPYGHTSPYLTRDYFPTLQHEHGMLAAFTTQQALIDHATPVYEIPRLVCADAWRTPQEFQAILRRIVHG